MPDADPVTTASGGVTVEKSFEPEDFPVPAIAFDVRSSRETAVSVRLVDTVPDDVASENIGFHPKYGAEFWNADGDEIVFERELGPKESYTTVYGLRGDDAARAGKFLDEPRLETVSPAFGDVPPSPDGAEPTGQEPDAESARTDESEADFDGHDAAISPDGAGSDPSTDTCFDSDRDLASGSDPAWTGDHGSSVETDATILGALAEELEAADPNDPDLVALRAALRDDPSASVATRIERLEATVAELEAYTGALESLLDEHGDARTALGDLRARQDRTADRVEEVGATAEEAREALEATETCLRREISATRADVEALEDEVATLSSDLEAVLEFRDALATALGGASLAPSGTGESAPDTGAEHRTGDADAHTTATEGCHDGLSDRK